REVVVRSDFGVSREDDLPVGLDGDCLDRVVAGPEIGRCFTAVVKRGIQAKTGHYPIFKLVAIESDGCDKTWNSSLLLTAFRHWTALARREWVRCQIGAATIQARSTDTEAQKYSKWRDLEAGDFRWSGRRQVEW